MFKNKHVVVALLVAPILAILSYFAVDHLVGEKPKAAQQGASYPLVARSNCRYNSGLCGLHNGEFKAVIEGAEGVPGRVLLTSEVVLEGARFHLGDAQPEAPQDMRPMDGSGLVWAFDAPAAFESPLRLRLVLAASGARYFGEVTTLFLVPSGERELTR